MESTREIELLAERFQEETNLQQTINKEGQMAKGEASVKDVKDYFSTPDHPIENKEILELKREDPEGYQEIKELLGKELGK